jgi:hypothetical protein
MQIRISICLFGVCILTRSNILISLGGGMNVKIVKRYFLNAVSMFVTFTIISLESKYRIASNRAINEYNGKIKDIKVALTY